MCRPRVGQAHGLICSRVPTSLKTLSPRNTLYFAQVTAARFEPPAVLTRSATTAQEAALEETWLLLLETMLESASIGERSTTRSMAREAISLYRASIIRRCLQRLIPAVTLA